MIATYYTRYPPRRDDENRVWIVVTNSATQMTASSTDVACVYDWDYDADEYTWSPGTLRPSIPPPPPPLLQSPQKWGCLREVDRPDVNALWRRPMRHFYRLHEEKRKGLKR